MKGALPLVVAALLAGCTVATDVQRAQTAPATLQPVASWNPGTPEPLPPMRSNSEMVEDFLELGFFMESGRPIPQFSRFEGPIALVTRGVVTPGAQTDLDRLLARFRAEAGIAISRAPGNSVPADANVITVEFVPRRAMRAIVPAAACFVVPNVDGWQDFVDNRRSPLIDWTRVVQRNRVAVFVPADTTPQEVRDCLHEEIAQALGPLNDLFRLTDSVFNDDNFQTTLTGFDMLMLRTWYAPDLRAGMTRGEVAARVPTILNRLNPAGRRSGGPSAGLTTRDWVLAIEEALGGDQGVRQRRASASRALSIARMQNYGGSRLALSLMLSARLAERNEGDAALMALLTASELYRQMPGGEVHAAHIDMNLAVQALASGQYDMVMDLTARARPLAQRTENAALLASLSFLRAEAMERMGNNELAQRLRLDSMAAARYGFGSQAAAQARIDEIARLGDTGARVAMRR